MGHLPSWAIWGYWLFLTWSCAQAILVPSMVQRKSSGVQTWSPLSQDNHEDRFSFSLGGTRLNRQIFEFDKELPIHSANLLALPSKIETPTSHESQFHVEHSETPISQESKTQSELGLPFSLEYLPPPVSPPALDYLPPSLDYLPPSLDYLPPSLPVATGLNIPLVATLDNVDQASRNLQEKLPPPSLDYLPPLAPAASATTFTSPDLPDAPDSVDQTSRNGQEILLPPSVDYLPSPASASNIPNSNTFADPESVDQTSRNLQEILALQDVSGKPYAIPPVYFTPPTAAEIHIPVVSVPPVYFTPPDEEFLPNEPNRQEQTVQVRWPDTLPPDTEVVQEIFQTTTATPSFFSVAVVNTPRTVVTINPPSKALVRAPSTSQSSSWDGVDPCTHAFHRWLCEGTKSRPKVAQFQTTQLITTTTPLPSPEPTTTPQPPLPEILNPPAASTMDQATIAPLIRVPLPTIDARPPAVSGWHGMDPCTHAFHRWLCDANRPKPTPATAQATSRNPTPASIRQEIALRLPEASELQPQNLAPAFVTAISSTPRPLSVEPWSGADPCTHPFHALLCQQANQNNNTPGARIAPLSPLGSNTINRSVVMPPPTITQPPLFLPQPLPSVIVAFRPPPFLNAPTTPKPHEGTDPRYHSFHAHSYQNDQLKFPLPNLASSASNSNSVSILPEAPREALVAEQQQARARSEKGNHGAWVFPSTDPCSHFLQAWLCKPSSSSPSRRSWHHRMTRHDPFLSAVTDSDEAAMVMDSVTFEAQRIRRRQVT